jgi:hypothetical protein
VELVRRYGLATLNLVRITDVVLTVLIRQNWNRKLHVKDQKVLCVMKNIRLVWFGLFVHPFSHICNIGHISYRLQFTLFYQYDHQTQQIC